ncbi:MAG: fumarylacetoacetate hydrolase family protein [Nitrososphaerota archaeon]|nr:fumarylacetoacetate hydrolase family protein [Nitrososphaerota archaeon]
MRLCTYEPPGSSGYRAGVVEGPDVIEVRGHRSVGSVVESGTDPRKVEKGGLRHRLSEVRLMAPVPRPGKILAAIVNTQAMLGGSDVRLEWPRLDMKAPSTVVGPGATIAAPLGGVRPEVELAAVVGKRISRATEEEAASAIFGYTVLNDVTAPADSRADAYEAYRRDRGSGAIRKATMRGPLFRSKNHDGFCPMGPWVMTPDEIEDLRGLGMTTRFDGTLVQEGSTSEYLFGPAAIASYVSGFLTLEPGDVLSCGSVGWTREALGEMDPTEYLLPDRGGVLELEISGIGKLVNPVSPRIDG